MAVTILERPEGRILGTTEYTATVSESYGAGDAQFVVTTVHNLNDGDFIYIVSDVEDYNGFWYVDATTTGIFKIKPYSSGDYVQFIQDATVTYYVSALSHGVSCVHLPITYRLSSNLYPTNESDSSQTISSVTDSNGYSVIHISGSLGSAVNSYDFIKLTLPSDTDYSGIYQIIEFISPTVMIINLEYDSSINWTSASALKHYNNYNIIVRVYAGINSSHQWTAQKPYELAATKEMTPDDNNEIFFSINEILKSYIETRNNTVLGTLPNNIDFWTNFYIEVAESYDDSDGYVFGRYTSNYTSDQNTFEGVAVNADLEFKNIHSGYLSAYLSPIVWLTLFDELSVFADQYFDVSFINSFSNISIGYRVNGVDYSTGQSGIGVYRIIPDPTLANVLTVYVLADGINEQPDNNTFTGSLSPWTSVNIEGTTRIAWSYNSNQARVALLAGETSEYLKAYNYPILANVIYELSIPITATFTSPSIEINVWGYNPGTLGTLIGTSPVNASPTTKTIQLNPTENYSTFMIQLVNPTGSAITLDMDSITVSITSAGVISEALTINVNSDCSNQEIDLQWLNNLGGFDAWRFTAKKDHIVEIQEALVTKKNILPTWPKSYGANADTIRKQTKRVSNKAYTIRSQFLTESQIDAIAFIKSSILVQIVNSRTDRRTVIVDADSFIKRKDGDKTFEIVFNVSFTNDIPTQTI